MQIEDNVVFDVIIRKLDAIDVDLKDVRNNISEIRVTQASQAKDLETHIKRTELAEESIKLLRKELEPARKITDFFKVGLQLVGVVSLVGGAITVVIKLFS